MTFIIAEMSANHGGSIDKAKEMIMAAKWAGCHAVKFQLYRKEDLPNTYDPALHVEMLPMLPELGEYCQKKYIKLVVSIFAWWAAEYLLEDKFPVYAIKFASPQSTRLEQDTYRRMARIIKDYVKYVWPTYYTHNLIAPDPIRATLWVSSGPRDWEFMRSLGADLLFYCPPGHPAELSEDDLEIVRLRGFSDHTRGIIAPLAAVKAGATHIEKHFMLDSNCVDSEFSINPDQMKMLCDLCS